MPEPHEIAEALAEPFDPGEVKFKPQHVTGNRALVIGYIDARVVMDRLDEVLGVLGWQDHYESLEGGSVVCRLKLLIGGEWVTKEDVGSMSEQPDEGDRMKAAFSDALKRAAVKFGVGRYLYRMKGQWVDYDPQKRQLVGTPRLAAEFLPRGREAGVRSQGSGGKSATVPYGTVTPQAAPPTPDSRPLTPDPCPLTPGQREIKDWHEWLDGGPTLAQFNEKLPAFASLPTKQLKAALWPLLLEHAQQLGWEFDKKARAFIHQQQEVA